MRLRWRWIVYGLVSLAIAIPVGAVLVAWSGVYNVAASRGHWLVTDFFLRFGMENSVKARAPNVQPPRLDDPDLIRLGAGHYHSGCAYCHAAPGIPMSPISQSMLPAPPDLQQRVGEWTDQELFWIVKHGIKYAGMPAWPAQARDDEVWTLVAFIRQLPRLDGGEYRALALGGVQTEPANGREIALGMRDPDAVAACARCHGADDRMPASDIVPRLHGQSAQMLLSALEAFAKGDRYSGIMQPVATALTPDTRRQLAAYYAGLTPPTPPGATADTARIEQGRRLAVEGDLAARIPACNGCHSSAALPLYPRLTGQTAPFIARQLRVWQRSERGRTELNAIMAPIAKRMTDEQIEAVAAYYASTASEQAAAPAPIREAGEP